jgi:hypothetical protein
MPSLRHFSRATESNELWKALDEDGGLIVDDFISPDLLERLRADVMPHVARHPGGSGDPSEFWADFHGRETKRITGLCAKSSAWAELLCDPLYQEMGDHYLGENAYHLNTAQLICIGPDETPQMLHRDEQNWPAASGQPHEITITAIFALTDFTEENGATVVVPGSHHWTDLEREVRPEDRGRATMKAGAALLYSGKIIHGGGQPPADDFPRDRAKAPGARPAPARIPILRAAPRRSTRPRRLRGCGQAALIRSAPERRSRGLGTTLRPLRTRRSETQASGGRTK